MCVVGSGVSGLVAGYYLSTEYDVTLLESTSELGMDSASRDFAGGRIDVPLRTFTRSYYPNLVRIYDEIGVQVAPPDYSYACYRHGDPTAYFRFVTHVRHWFSWGVLGVEKLGLPAMDLLLSRSTGPKLVRNLYTWYWFLQDGFKELQRPDNRLASITFKEYVLSKYSRSFYEDFLLPMLSVVCTCSFEAVGAYPAEVLVDYLAGKADEFRFGAYTERAVSGTKDVVRRLSSRCSRVLTSCRVTELVPASPPSSTKCRVTWSDANSGSTMSEEFDHVIVATQANSALALMGKHASEDLKRALGAVKYERTKTVLHTDERVLPARPSDRGAVSLCIESNGTKSDCTVWMNKIDKVLADTLQRDVFQSWNPVVEPDKDKVVYEAWFERPVLTLESASALDTLAKAQGQGNVWFIGAFSLYSMPLLENGARSAIRVANKLLKGSKVPEIGTQISGAPFARRRPDLVRFSSSSSKRSPASSSSSGVGESALVSSSWVRPSIVLGLGAVLAASGFVSVGGR